MKMDPVELLDKVGIRPTSNRILVLKELIASDRPVSLAELEESLDTLEKSSVFRVLTIFLQHGIIHDIEDGRGIVKYEVCGVMEHCSLDDMHVHFYCEKCRRVWCFEHLPVPDVVIPSGFAMHSVNYMIKGVCPGCGSGGGQ